MCRAIRSTLRCVKRWHPAGISASRPPSFSVSRIGSRRRQPGNRIHRVRALRSRFKRVILTTSFRAWTSGSRRCGNG
jgi:hypothetical protein